MNQELLRIIDGLARDKNIDKETVFEDLEAAMLSAIRKAYMSTDDIVVRIDRGSGDITVLVDGEPRNIREFGRIPAQTAKQVIIQRIREAERGSIYEEFVERKGQIVTGRAARWEGGTLIVDIGRAEAILPRSEQIPGESHQPEERIRAMVLDVREQPSQVKIVLSRTHPDFIRAMFELEVPEVAEGIIEIKVLAREAGYRTKVAVSSLDSKVDAVGACVGVRGSRIKNIVNELGGEKIDIVRWNDSSKILIANSLKPAEVAEIALCFELGRATVVVVDDQLSLAIGKRGQNVRLAARLTGWDIDILTPSEFNQGLDVLERALREVPGVDSTVVDQTVAMGMVNVLDVEEVGPDPLVNELSMDRELARLIVVRCAEEARRVAEQRAAEQEAKKAQEAAEAAGAAEAATEVVEPAEGADAAEATTEAPQPAEGAGAPEAPAEVPQAVSEPAGSAGAPEAPAPDPEAALPAAEPGEPPAAAPEATAEPSELASEVPEAPTEPPEAASEVPEAATEAPEAVAEAPEAATETPEPASEVPEAATEAPEPAQPAEGSTDQPKADDPQHDQKD